MKSSSDLYAIAHGGHTGHFTDEVNHRVDVERAVRSMPALHFYVWNMRECGYREWEIADLIGLSRLETHRIIERSRKYIIKHIEQNP